MTSTTYHGWSNYATWRLAAELEEADHDGDWAYEADELVSASAADCGPDGPDLDRVREALARKLETHYERLARKASPRSRALADLAAEALEDVNWQQLALPIVDAACRRWTFEHIDKPCERGYLIDRSDVGGDQ
jgi:hypothetical protein